MATKSHIPGPVPGFVPRPRLMRMLGEGLTAGRASVCAPAGSGKTALLAGWVRDSGRAVAWVGLDGGDSDPARFWRYAVAAVDRVRPGLAGRLDPLFGPPTPRSFEGLVTALINELADGPGADGLLLVLDDYHLVDSGAVHESVAFLLDHVPPGLTVVVSSRSDPPLPLARLRARGQLAEVRAADLRFTPDEAAALLDAVVGPGLPASAVQALTARTEGWEGRIGSVIEIQALLALVAAADGDQAGALAALTEALALASPHGYVRAFADEGAPMHALLARLSATRAGSPDEARRIDPGHLAAVLSACGPADAAPRRRSGTASPGLSEPLTGRELEVLKLLAAGASNQRIAHDLVVALDTVKKHVTHVLGKLGAANRTEAAARARQLGLIP